MDYVQRMAEREYLYLYAKLSQVGGEPEHRMYRAAQAGQIGHRHTA